MNLRGGDAEDRPVRCPMGHGLAWVAPAVAVCACKGSHIWRWEEKRRALRVETNAVARGLAETLNAGGKPAPAPTRTGAKNMVAQKDRVLVGEGNGNGVVEHVTTKELPKRARELERPDRREELKAEQRSRLLQANAQRKDQREQERAERLTERRILAGLDARSRVRVTYIPLASLRPGKINRDLIDGLVWEIAEKFEWESLQALVVEDNGDATYTVREGHHRFAALGLVFATDPDTEVPCVITQPRGEVAAATTVGNINITRKAWTGLGKFTLKVHQQDATAQAVAEMLRRMDLRPAEKIGRAAGPGDVTGVVAAYDCAKRGGIGAVQRTFSVLKAAWGSDPDAYRVGMVKGTWDFLLRYALAPQYRPDVLIKALSATRMRAIYDSAARKHSEAKAASAAEQRPNAVDERTAISWAIFDAYSAYIRKKPAYKRLPDFGVPSTPAAGSQSLTARIKEYRQWETKQA